MRGCEKQLPASLVSLLALAKARSCAAMVRFAARALISTMTWRLEVLDETVGTEAASWLIRTSAQMVRDSYSSQPKTA